MCVKFLPENLNLDSCLRHSTSTYTRKVTITTRMRSIIIVYLYFVVVRFIYKNTIHTIYVIFSSFSPYLGEMRFCWTRVGDTWKPTFPTHFLSPAKPRKISYCFHFSLTHFLFTHFSPQQSINALVKWQIDASS